MKRRTSRRRRGVACAEGRRDVLAKLAQRFPHNQVPIQNVLAVDDQAALNAILEGSHRAPLTGPDGSQIPSMGGHISVPYAQSSRSLTAKSLPCTTTSTKSMCSPSSGRWPNRRDRKKVIPREAPARYAWPYSRRRYIGGYISPIQVENRNTLMEVYPWKA
jgi:hypothetical protein